MIGLGTGSNYDSFGAQFCLPRNAGNPVLSVRYKESSIWGGWNGITASVSNSLASGASAGNISIGSGCKIFCADNYHFIYFNQGSNILQLQEYGTIHFQWVLVRHKWHMLIVMV